MTINKIPGSHGNARGRRNTWINSKNDLALKLNLRQMNYSRSAFFLLENPEIAYDEFKACDHLGHVLEQKGFQVENGVGNVDT